MRIDRTNSTVVVLLRHDQVPFVRLLNRDVLQSLEKAFAASSATIKEGPEGAAAIELTNAVSEVAGEETHIPRVSIEERKIVVKADGTSEKADGMLLKVIEMLGEIGKGSGENYLTPVVRTYESELTCQLAFEAWRLLDQELMDFATKDIEAAAATTLATAHVRPVRIRFAIEFVPNDNMLNTFNVSLSRKEFVLEPRLGFPIQERVYFSSAPLDTSSHIRLLEELEKRLLSAEQ